MAHISPAASLRKMQMSMEPKRIEIESLSARSTEPDSDKSQDSFEDMDLRAPPGLESAKGLRSRATSFGSSLGSTSGGSFESSLCGTDDWTGSPRGRPRNACSFDSTATGHWPGLEADQPASVPVPSFVAAMGTPPRAPPGLEFSSTMPKPSQINLFEQKVEVSLDSLVSGNKQASQVVPPTAASAPTWFHPAAATLQAPTPSSADMKAAHLELIASQLMAQAQQARSQAYWLHQQHPAQQLQNMAIGLSLANAIAAPPQSVHETKAMNSASEFPSAHTQDVDVSNFTTVMLRNLPNKYTRTTLMELLDSRGFAGFYDFVYMPVDFKRNASFGYAFVNMVTHEAAERCFTAFQGYSKWTMCSSSKILQVAWGEPLQGLEAHVERYRNSPVMHQEVRDEFKPVLLKDGVQIDFPPPTRKIRKPHVKVGQGDSAPSYVDESNRVAAKVGQGAADVN